MSKKVLCINAEPRAFFILNGIIPLKEGKVYEVRSEGQYAKGYGYLLKGVKNRCCHDAPTVELSYSAKRFVELSEVDGVELLLTEKEFV